MEQNLTKLAEKLKKFRKDTFNESDEEWYLIMKVEAILIDNEED